MVQRQQSVSFTAMARPTPQPRDPTAGARALGGIRSLLLAGFIVATLYFAREILMPVALAALVTFLLAPSVTRLERWLGRIGAVLLVVILVLGTAAGVGWVVSRQLVELAARLPDYQENIRAKLRSLQAPLGDRFARLSETLEDLKRDLPGHRTPEVVSAPGRSAPAVDGELRPGPVIPVQFVERSPSGPYELVRAILAPLLGPLGTAALVLLLVIFMLLRREDLRSRLLRLMGQGRLIATTRAMDDAGARVAKYLRTQFILNATYGMMVTVGLFFIGLPNAPLWGVFAAVLRYIPYVGPWIGATLPVALSLAISPGWGMPFVTLGWFVMLELLANNVLEPWLFGSSTGVSPIALILAAVGWAWLWGPVGLVLATPMTVCLVVLGRHVPRLSFLSILLGDEQALTPFEDCYCQLLTVGGADEMEWVDSYLKAHSLTVFYDEVLIPVLSTLEIDHRLQLLDDGQHRLVEQSLREIVEDLGTSASDAVVDGPLAHRAPGVMGAGPRCRVYCVPARTARDELVGTMLVQLLRCEGFEAQGASMTSDAGALVDQVERAAVAVVCISVVAPSTVLHARQLCLKLRARLHKQCIVVGLWGAMENRDAAARRVRDSGADRVVTTLADAMVQMRECGARPPAAVAPAAVPVAATETPLNAPESVDRMATASGESGGTSEIPA